MPIIGDLILVPELSSESDNTDLLGETTEPNCSTIPLADLETLIFLSLLYFFLEQLLAY